MIFSWKFHTSVGRLVNCSIHQLCADTGLDQEDQPNAMTSRAWMVRERVKGINTAAPIDDTETDDGVIDTFISFTNDRKENFRGAVAKVRDCGLASSNSCCAITFNFRLIPLGKA